MNLLKILCAFLLFLTSLPPVYGQAENLVLPVAGVLKPSPAYDPALVKGLTIHPENPFLFDFIVEPGQDKLSQEELKGQSMAMIKYFLACLAVPEKDMWVNLSPYEKDRIVPEALGQTLLGRDMLSLDYLLKQMTASLIYPESQLGQEFWTKVYAESQAKFGTTQVPINTFNKVWIVPDKATVWEHGKSVFVTERHLNVMLEEDYLAISKNAVPTKSISDQIVRDIVLPALEREVNEGKTFAQLRQVYNSMILATWYKQRLKETVLSKNYVDQGKIKGIDTDDPEAKQKIYDQYVKLFKQGVFDFIREEPDPATGQAIPRKYFSGGLNGVDGAMLQVQDKKPSDPAQLPTRRAVRVVVDVQRDHTAQLPADPAMSLSDNPLMQEWLTKDESTGIAYLRVIQESLPPTDQVKIEQEEDFLMWVLLDPNRWLRTVAVEINNWRSKARQIDMDVLLGHMRQPWISAEDKGHGYPIRQEIGNFVPEMAWRNKRLALLILFWDAMLLPNMDRIDSVRGPYNRQVVSRLIKDFNEEGAKWNTELPQTLEVLRSRSTDKPYAYLEQRKDMSFWDVFFTAYMDFRIRTRIKGQKDPYEVWFGKEFYLMSRTNSAIMNVMSEIDQYVSVSARKERIEKYVFDEQVGNDGTTWRTYGVKGHPEMPVIKVPIHELSDSARESLMRDAKLSSRYLGSSIAPFIILEDVTVTLNIEGQIKKVRYPVLIIQQRLEPISDIPHFIDARIAIIKELRLRGVQYTDSQEEKNFGIAPGSGGKVMLLDTGAIQITDQSMPFAVRFPSVPEYTNQAPVSSAQLSDQAQAAADFESEDIVVSIKKGLHTRPILRLIDLAKKAYKDHKIEMWLIHGSKVHSMTIDDLFMKSAVSQNSKVKIRINGGSSEIRDRLFHEIVSVLTVEIYFPEEKTSGGIDMDANKLDLTVKGKDTQENLALPDSDAAKVTIDGLNPVILKMEPVNLAELIGSP